MEDGFDVVKSEAVNQYRALMETDDSHNTKIGILMGFIVVSLTQVALNLFRPEGTAGSAAFVLRSGAIVMMALSVYYGLRYIVPKRMSYGPNIVDLRDRYNAGEGLDLEVEVCANYIKAYKENEPFIMEKGQAIKRMISSYFVGLALLAASQILLVI